MPGLTYSEPKYVFGCYTTYNRVLRIQQHCQVGVQGPPVPLPCAYAVSACHVTSRRHRVFHLILGSIKYLKHGQPFCPNYSKGRFPIKWTFSSSYQFFFFSLISGPSTGAAWSRSWHLSQALPPGWRTARVQVAFHKQMPPLLCE